MQVPPINDPFPTNPDPIVAALRRALETANPSGARETMKALGAELERLWAIERQANAFGTDDELGAACAASSAMAHRILAVPARTLEEFKVKGRALSWCYSGGDIDMFSDCDETTDVKVVQSIIRDLLAV